MKNTKESTPTAGTSGSLAVPVPWDQHRAVLLLAREMCQTLQIVNPAKVHDDTLVEINDQLARWENFQRIVAEAEAEYAAGRSLDSLDDKGGDAQWPRIQPIPERPCTAAPTSDPAARQTSDEQGNNQLVGGVAPSDEERVQR